MNFFPLSWHEQIEDKQQIIQCFGWSEAGKYCCLTITGFTPYFYVKLRVPDSDVKQIRRALRNPYEKLKVVDARGLYSNAFKGMEKYCFISFKNSMFRAVAANALKSTYQICENKANSVLQMTCCRGVNISDWFKIAVGAPEQVKRTYCDEEYTLHWKEIFPCDVKPAFIPSPVVMSYDIETFAHNVNIFPDPKHPEDVIFQISIIIKRGEDRQQILLTLGTPNFDYLDESIEVYTFKSEAKLLLFYAELVRKYSPQILIGYNTFNFDNTYMIERAKFLMILDDFSKQGYTREKSKVFTSGWSSSAYSNQKFCYLDLKGRIHVDMMVFIQREYKLDSYKLNAVASHFLGSKKDPLTYYHIRECYLKGMQNPEEESKAISYVGKYCVKDSALVLDLYEELKFWNATISMASVCHTSVVDLFAHGQTARIFCQVYKYCSDNNIIVENDIYKAQPDEFVEGAFVLPPKSGLYDNIVSFDFASLYPSIMIGHNIDFSTLVSEEDEVKDEDCNLIEWDEHYGCGCPEAKPIKKARDGRKFVICKHYKVKWLKEPKGVIPTIIENLLRARKEVRAKMEKCDPDSVEYSLLNQLQLALKVSANSMYGGMSSRFGSLQFLIGGMCITAIGRRSIKRVSEIMENKYGAKVVYGDTDSNYVKFRDMSPADLYAYCLKVSAEVSANFPPPMKLEFEGKIFEKYFLFTKKRYIYRLLGKQDLKVSGVLLKRRDSAPIVKEIYKKLVDLCLDKAREETLWACFFDQMCMLLSGYRNAEEYAIGRSVKTIDSFETAPHTETKIRFGCYIISKLSQDEKKRAGQLKKKGAISEADFCYRSLPNHVQLALKMKKRGQTIQNGERLSFLYIKGHPKAPTADKMEDIEYFEMFHRNSDIDTAEYFRLLCERPLSELFSIYLGRDCTEFFVKIWKTGARRNALNDEYKELLLKHEVVLGDKPPAARSPNSLLKYFK